MSVTNESINLGHYCFCKEKNTWMIKKMFSIQLWWEKEGRVVATSATIWWPSSDTSTPSTTPGPKSIHERDPRRAPFWSDNAPFYNTCDRSRMKILYNCRRKKRILFSPSLYCSLCQNSPAISRERFSEWTVRRVLSLLPAGPLRGQTQLKPYQNYQLSSWAVSV